MPIDRITVTYLSGETRDFCVGRHSWMTCSDGIIVKENEDDKPDVYKYIHYSDISYLGITKGVKVE